MSVRNRLPKYCYEEKDRHGNWRIYFRKRGQRKVRLHGESHSPEFLAQYAEALKASTEPSLTTRSKVQFGTWRWLCEQYMKSAEFHKLSRSTTDTRRRILESTWKEPIAKAASEVFGDMPIAKMTPKAVKVLRDRKAARKTAGNDRRKIIGYVFAWGMENHDDLVKVNPVRDVGRLKHTPQPHPPWSHEDFREFMNKYPAGSKERRAMALHLYTGARGCDVRQFGPQHVKNGRFAFTQQKTGGAVDLPLLNDLATELALAPKDALLYIRTSYGKAYSQKGYGNWFNEKARKAGLLNRTAHGIRAGAATIMAEKGATVHQLMAVFGWCSEKMAIRYTERASKKLLADAGAPLISLEQKAS